MYQKPFHNFLRKQVILGRVILKSWERIVLVESGLSGGHSLMATTSISYWGNLYSMPWPCNPSFCACSCKNLPPQIMSCLVRRVMAWGARFSGYLSMVSGHDHGIFSMFSWLSYSEKFVHVLVHRHRKDGCRCSELYIFSVFQAFNFK